MASPRLLDVCRPSDQGTLEGDGIPAEVVVPPWLDAHVRVRVHDITPLKHRSCAHACRRRGGTGGSHMGPRPVNPKARKSRPSRSFVPGRRAWGPAPRHTSCGIHSQDGAGQRVRYPPDPMHMDTTPKRAARPRRFIS